MSNSYHWSPRAEEYLECSSPSNCLYGGDHFASIEEAYASRFDDVATPVKSASGVLSGKLSKLSTEQLEQIIAADTEQDANATFDKVQKECATAAGMAKYTDELEARKQLAGEYWSRIEPLDKIKAEGGDRKLFADKKRAFALYRDNTAAIVEARLKSSHYPAAVIEDESERIGSLNQITSHDPNTREWLEARQETMGGSDVGIVAVMDFDRDGKETSQFRGLHKTKTRGYSEEELQARENQDDTRSGALYRGNAWEDQIREDFANDHKDEYTVLNNKGQFAHPDRPWQQCNFDGLICAKGTTKPEGILEIKTGSEPKKWDNGVPLDYRAQTLYYLNATGFKYAKVRALINDHDVREYTIYADEPVKQGGNQNMSEFIKQRIAPLQAEFAAERKAAKSGA